MLNTPIEIQVLQTKYINYIQQFENQAVITTQHEYFHKKKIIQHFIDKNEKFDRHSNHSYCHFHSFTVIYCYS